MISQLVTDHFLAPRRFLESDRPTKNVLEKKWIDTAREKLGNPSDLALLQKTFDRMK